MEWRKEIEKLKKGNRWGGKSGRLSGLKWMSGRMKDGNWYKRREEDRMNKMWDVNRRMRLSNGKDRKEERYNLIWENGRLRRKYGDWEK